jgi:hypothetical protein
MREGLTGGFQISIKHITKLTPDKISHRDSVIVNIVFDHSQDHNTQSTFIIETILL